jgi:hypothetical protein
MAGNNNGNIIRPIRSADGTGCTVLANEGSNLTVRSRFTEWDPEELIPHCHLKVRSLEIKRHCKALSPSVEVFVYLLFGPVNAFVRSFHHFHSIAFLNARPDSIESSPVCELEEATAAGGCPCHKIAGTGFQYSVKNAIRARVPSPENTRTPLQMRRGTRSKTRSRFRMRLSGSSRLLQ